ncbi:MAG: ATPase [Bacteroidetes bacterium 4572_77]|nr:MAG: ATPase [Bacteroidetes bacterium 4572_77]
MQKSPFIFGNTVSAHSFTNRDKERKKLEQNLISGINTMIISPRRWGKSSLVEKVLQDIKKEYSTIKCVSIDLFSVSTEEEFLELFAKEVIKSTSTKWEDWVATTRDVFKQLLPSISFGIDPVNDFKINFNWEELQEHSREILNLPERLAISKGIKIVIAIDEFQNLAEFPNFTVFEKKMRSYWQKQKNTSYCLFGSKRHMMTEIFADPGKPFYKFGDLILLQKIKAKDWIPFLIKSFKKTGKTITPKTAEKIALLMKNHPWYVQQLSHYCWNNSGKIVELEDLNRALRELISANSPLFQREIEILSSSQVNLLKAIVSGEEKLTSTRVMQQYHLGTPRNVSKNKALFLRNDLAESVNKKLFLLDPAFELWFRWQFFKEPIFDLEIM